MNEQTTKERRKQGETGYHPAGSIEESREIWCVDSHSDADSA